MAALLPRLAIAAVRCTPLGAGHWALRVTVENLGDLPSHGVNAARERPWNTGVEAHLAVEGCRLLAPGEARQSLGHLAGWGRGLGEAAQMPWFQRSPGNDHQATARWILQGEGEVRVRVGGPRLGQLTLTLPIPADSHR